MQSTESRNTKRTDNAAWRPKILPGMSLPARRGLLVLTSLLLAGFCAILAICGHHRRTDSAGIVLLDATSSSNLNNTSAETSASAPGQEQVTEVEQDPLDSRVAVTPSLLPPRAVETVAEVTAITEPPEPELLAMPAPVRESLPLVESRRPLAPVELVPIVPVTVFEPVRENCFTLHDPQLGDTPMMRTWKMLGLNALLAATLAASPGLAIDPQVDADKLAAINKQLEELKKSLGEVEKSVATLSAVKKGIEDARAESATAVQTVQSGINELKTQFLTLKLDLENLRNSLSTSARTSMFTPNTDTGTVTATGRVELINTYPQPVSIVINGRSYQLAPGERQMSNPIPAGSFWYEVLGVTRQEQRTVAADKVFTVWVHPQR